MTKRPYTMIIGAAGRIGTSVTKGLSGTGRKLKLIDIEKPDLIPPDATFVKADINDYPTLHSLCREANSVIHLAGHPNSTDWGVINELNIKGTWSVFDAAVNAGVRKIIYASSIHVAGYRPAGNLLQNSSGFMPDGLYGLSKCFGELLLNYYSDRFGISALSLRICSFKPKPVNKRDLSTWISPNDMTRLIEASLNWRGTKHNAIWGTSNNSLMKLDTKLWDEIGYTPMDSADHYTHQVSDKEWEYLGGHVIDYRHLFGDGTTD